MGKLYTQLCLFLLFSLGLSVTYVADAQTLTRGPYLQIGKQDSMTIRWRSSTATNSKVTWGPVFGSYPNSLTTDIATPVTEHIVRIGGLTADTKYWYTIGYSVGAVNTDLQATNTNYFLTLPPANTTRKLRFLALGDCGLGSANQTNVMNTFKTYIGSNDVDAMLLLGDNAYTTGSDAEYTSGFFNIYKDEFLKYYKLYPAPGNHDYGNTLVNNTKTGSTPANSMPYHLNFTTPMGGEMGGVASGVKNYYSYEIGDVHLISLDSYGKDATFLLSDTFGPQITWLKADLAANTKKWTVAYFHHPPYTKTSHSSDVADGETDLVAIRERFIRILERNGVDLIICGHSHGYERSYLLKGFYNTYASSLSDGNFNAATHTATASLQNAKYDGSALACPFTYNSGKFNHGSVYIVAGSAGQVSNASQKPGYPQDCMYSNYVSTANGGCFYFEVDSNRLDAKYISYTTAPTPIVRDQFTIFKDVNKTQNVTALLGTPSTLTASWRGNYYWPNNGGATTQEVTISNAVVGSFVYTVRDANAGSCIQDVFNVTVSATLPITLTSFTATLNTDKVLLDWKTSEEQNNKFFTVERSTDRIHFTVLGKVNGKGTSTVENSYRLVDFTPADGINYYRLSQTDFDGNTTYNDTKRITYKNGKNFTAAFVNLPNRTINMVINSSKTDVVSMTVFDMVGNKIKEETFAISAGGTIKNLQLQNGVYVVELANTNGDRISNKIKVQ
ncbi:MAG: metallophosphoesterase [Ferruginibacter sp.]